MVELVNTVPDGLRHLRNFAKKRRKVDILKAIYEFLNRKRPDEVANSGLQSNEFSEVAEIFKQVYEADNLKQREKLMERAAKSVQVTNKDQFFVKLIGETNEVSKKQLQIFKENNGKVKIMDESLSTVVEYYVKLNNDKSDDEAKNIKRQFGLVEATYFTWVVKAYAEAKNWAEVNKFIKMGPKKCPVPLATIAEICHKEGNKELSKDALMQIPKDPDRVE